MTDRQTDRDLEEMVRNTLCLALRHVYIERDLVISETDQCPGISKAPVQFPSITRQNKDRRKKERKGGEGWVRN